MTQENMSPQEIDTPSTLFKVTPFSKYFAMVLFVALPFVGGLVGYTFAPEKVVEVERMVVRDAEPSKQDATTKPAEVLIIDQGEYKMRYSVGATDIEVLDKDMLKVVQIIPLDASVVATMSNIDELFIAHRDINYDHYLDVGILGNVGSGGKSLFYDFYVYDPETRVLKNELIFGEGDGVNISNPRFDIPNKKVISAIRNGLTWMYIEYLFDGTAYVKGKSWSEADGE